MSSPHINTANPAGSPKVTDLRVVGQSLSGSSSAFDRITALATRLVPMPKKEVDAERREGE
jgi:hypothetical protein